MSSKLAHDLNGNSNSSYSVLYKGLFVLHPGIDSGVCPGDFSKGQQ